MEYSEDDEMDVGDEHEDDYGHNEYIRQYDCNVKMLTWQRDSYGLYDYEFADVTKCSFKFCCN